MVVAHSIDLIYGRNFPVQNKKLAVSGGGGLTVDYCNMLSLTRSLDARRVPLQCMVLSSSVWCDNGKLHLLVTTQLLHTSDIKCVWR